MSLTFEELWQTNAARFRELTIVRGGDFGADWTPADWMVAVVGEVGEAANVMKKLRRDVAFKPNEIILDGETAMKTQELLVKLGEELADIVIYIDLISTIYGIDLASAIVDKFNKSSDKFGSTVKFR